MVSPSSNESSVSSSVSWVIEHSRTGDRLRGVRRLGVFFFGLSVLTLFLSGLLVVPSGNDFSLVDLSLKEERGRGTDSYFL